MFTNEEVEHLMGLEKHVKDPSVLVDLAQARNRIELVAPAEPEFHFLIDISENKKITFKVSMHAQEDGSKVGLFRVDYKGRHLNPSQVTDHVPERFKPFVGKWFEVDEPHAHFHVAGFKPLAWALPLSEAGFPVAAITSMADLEQAIRIFARHLKVSSELRIQSAIV